MASSYRILSRPAVNLLKSTISKTPSRPTFSILSPHASPSRSSRPLSQIATLQSLLPLHAAISSARLTSCLGIDTKGCRSLSKGMLCSSTPGV